MYIYTPYYISMLQVYYMFMYIKNINIHTYIYIYVLCIVNCIFYIVGIHHIIY